MTVLLELEPDIEARVTAQAKARGIPVTQYLHTLIQHGLSTQASEASALQPSGWPADFFAHTYGALAADPLERLPQWRFISNILITPTRRVTRPSDPA